MTDLLLLRPVFLLVFVSLAVVYVVLKIQLARRSQHRPDLDDEVSPELRALDAGRETSSLFQAMERAGRVKDSRAVDALGRLLSHPDPAVSAAAANTLGQIGDERALVYLLESSRRLEREIDRIPAAPQRTGALQAAPPPAPVLGDLVWPDAATGRRLLDLHSKPGPAPYSSIVALLALAADRQSPAPYRYFALKNLELALPSLELPDHDSHPGSPSPAPLLPGVSQLAHEVGLMLADEEPTVRYAAIGFLEVLDTPDVARYLEGAATDPNRFVRARAAIALASVAPGRARKHLFALLSEADPQLKKAIQKRLDEIADS